MSRVIVSEFVTLDCVMEAPGGEPTHLHSGRVGGGKRFFPESRQKKPLRLADTKTFPSGVVVHTYHPAGS
ncbi:MAG: hypothetical protein WD271_02730 [Acidimicrobiia bacterium]